MKQANRNQQSPQYNRHKSAPENKDNLDSRKNEEQQFKGDDVTHNKKQHHNRPSADQNKKHH